MDNAQCVELKAILSDIIDKNVDSLRFYYLGNNYQTKIEHIGIERGISADQQTAKQCDNPQRNGFQHSHALDLIYYLRWQFCHASCHTGATHYGCHDSLHNGKQCLHKFHSVCDCSLSKCKPDKCFQYMFRLFQICKTATRFYDSGCKKSHQFSSRI